MAVAYFPTAIKQFKYGKGPIPFRACDWTAFDFDKIKDLIENCLKIDPSQRITVTEALNHPWLDE
jgi:serine/threonine protein kinase